MVKHPLILALLFGLLACNSSVETVSITDENGDLLEYNRRKSDFAKHGEYLRKNEQGQLLEKASFHNDTLHGERILYFSNGQPEIIERYEKGVFVGTYQLYHESGQLKQQGEYIGGSMEGEWKSWYETGQLREVVLFKENEENGPFVEYHKNGKLKAEGQYLNGDFEHGLLKLYDESGELVKKMDCVKGVCRTIWTKEDGDVTPDKS